MAFPVARTPAAPPATFTDRFCQRLELRRWRSAAADKEVALAQALKHFFDEKVVCGIARDLARAYPPFPERDFITGCLAKLTTLELTARAWHIAETMQACLPKPFAAAARVLVRSLGAELERTDGNGLLPFFYLPHVFFVQKYGLEDFEPALRAQYELTKRMTAESSIRPYLERYPARTLARLREWSADPNVHVRRLVSEGTRPRLPWAPRLRAFQKDPRPVLELLELLKDDPERYVQRSVANNLNDIGKDHPDLAVAVCRDLMKHASPGRAWIVRHALRSLVKKGHRGALDTLGVGHKAKVKVGHVELVPRLVRLGGELRFSFVLASTAKRAQKLVVDYTVHYVKANGSTRPKVFKLRKLDLLPAARVKLEGRIAFKDMTTRRHHPGRHRIDALINGVSYPLMAFAVRR